MTEIESRNFLQITLSAIKQHLGNADFNVEELSRKVGLSRMQFHRRLRELGLPAAGELLRNVRLEHAAELLRQRRLAIAEVAYRSGFRSPAYFAHCFRSRYGCSPRQFARNGGIKHGESRMESGAKRTSSLPAPSSRPSAPKKISMLHT